MSSTDRSEVEVWRARRAEALDCLERGEPLAAAIGVLVIAVTQHWGRDVRCAFYLADSSLTELRHVVGMGASYAECVDGFKIGPDSLACGLAVYKRTPVITPDVMDEPLWTPWQWLAREYKFRGCWSFPVETTPGTVIGTFAMYFPEPRPATDADRDAIEQVTRAAAAVFLRHQRTRAASGARSDMPLELEFEEVANRSAAIKVLLDRIPAPTSAGARQAQRPVRDQIWHHMAALRTCMDSLREKTAGDASQRDRLRRAEHVVAELELRISPMIRRAARTESRDTAKPR